MNRKAFKAGTFLLSSAAIISAIAAVEAPFTVGTWANFCKGAISHTFDDYPTSSTNQQVASGQAAFDEKGFHMTLNVLPGSCNDANWNSLKAAFAKGHEIASHNNAHNSEVSGLKPSQTTIKSKVPGEMCVTIAYPNCTNPGASAVLQTYIAGRICGGTVNPKSISDYSKVDSKMFGSGQCGCPNTANDLNNFANQAATNGGWAVTCNHGIGSDGHTWAVTNLNAMKDHLTFLDQNRDKIWCETFGNVARYIKERDAASLAVKTTAANSITITLTDNLADSIFNYPLTIRRPLPDGWTTVAVTQDGKAVGDTVLTVDGAKVIQFNAVPDGGDIVIQSGTMVKNLALTPASRNTLVFKNSTLSIDVGSFSGSTVAVSLFDLKGKLFAQHSVNKNTSIVSIPLGNMSNSLFVARVTDGNTTVVSRCLSR